MSNRTKTAIAVAFAIFLAHFEAVCAQAQATQTTEPRTVVDYFLLLPDSYVDGGDRQEMVRNGNVDIVDIKNGYILYDASDNPSGCELAIFRKSNGRYLVAYSTGIFWDPDFPGGASMLRLMIYEGGKWRTVTNSVLPVKFNQRLVYKLPRYGRTIEVTETRGRKVYTLTWRNDRFHLKRPTRK